MLARPPPRDVQHRPRPVAGRATAREAGIDAVVPHLGDEAVAAGAPLPGRCAGAVGARPGRARRAPRRPRSARCRCPGVDMPVLTLIQVRLVAELAAIHDRSASASSAPLEAARRGGRGLRLAGDRRAAPSASFPAPAGPCGARSPTAPRAPSARPRSRASQAGHDLIEGAAAGPAPPR